MKGITRARGSEVEERVLAIVVEMRELRWRRGVSNRELAKGWGVSVGAVNDYAAEASRRVRAEVTDPDEVSATVATVLAANLDRASSAAEYGDVAKLADVWTKIVGARAPEKHEHTVYAGLQPAQALDVLDAQIAKLQAARERLYASVHVVQALPASPDEPERRR